MLCYSESVEADPPPILYPHHLTRPLALHVQTICVAGGYKSVKPIILQCHSFNREMKVLSLANVGWDRKNRVPICISCRACQVVDI